MGNVLPCVSGLVSSRPQVFSKVVDKLYAYVHPKTGKKAGLIADDVYDIIQKNKQRLNSALIMDRDFDYDYFGFKTLEK